jgi:hypothetical protein
MMVSISSPFTFEESQGSFPAFSREESLGKIPEPTTALGLSTVAREMQEDRALL